MCAYGYDADPPAAILERCVFPSSLLDLPPGEWTVQIFAKSPPDGTFRGNYVQYIVWGLPW